MMLRRFIISASLALLVVAVALFGLNVFRLAHNARLLTTIALLEPSEWSPNPASVNFNTLSPSVARWILLHSNLPYGPCDSKSLGCDITLVAYAGRALVKEHSPKRAMALELLRHFITRGEPVSAISQGLTPLHEAVLFEDPEYADLLIRAGADIHVRADMVAKSAAGLTALEYCRHLEQKRGASTEVLCRRIAYVGT